MKHFKIESMNCKNSWIHKVRNFLIWCVDPGEGCKKLLKMKIFAKSPTSILRLTKQIWEVLLYSSHFLTWYTILGYSPTSYFFREFWSESHRILFLGQLLGVFSIRNSGMMIFQGQIQNFDKNEKVFFCWKTASQGGLWSSP